MGTSIKIAAILLFLMVFAIAGAAGLAGSPTGQSPSWLEHSDLLSVIVAGLFSLVLFFMLRTLNKLDRNQGLMFAKLDMVCKQVDTLQGEHNVMMRGHGGHGDNIGRAPVCPSAAEDPG